ncbi:outer membrane porin, OprD family [Sulfurimonas aquatica]|uniref:Outer membrane porin, OprD family n=1 Tax=Sulfurimonas aquatica TaxID=2672570 RepID=A0A975GDJ4_9BACT|nr:OprD family outer membrane porin [Sulfurimonas aquatica]QSZ42652.1 outer membrane porin, OprD family [Sulfurimonas aquatica]
MKKKSLIGLTFLTISTIAQSNDVVQSVEKEDRARSVREVVSDIRKNETKEPTVVDNFKHMFEAGKVSGTLRVMGAGYKNKAPSSVDTYATAIGGLLKYELAEYNGFNAGVAVSTSQDIPFATGDKNIGEQNSELSSVNGSYTTISEAYLNYKYNDFNFRIGRQVIDTPLADSDDIRMVHNTFEAYIATYDFKEIAFMAGHLNSWQGTDAGVDDGWIEAGENGVTFAGASYSEDLTFEAWYYNFSEYTNAIYLEAGIEHDMAENIQLHGVLQYLNETQLQGSGIGANVYGALVELIAYDIGFGIAYNGADKQNGKSSFSALGGGALFTSMDTFIIDEIAQDRDASALLGGIRYELDNFHFYYAYALFDGKADSSGAKAKLSEQNMGFEYNVNDEFLVSALYAISTDLNSDIKTDSDWDRVQLMVNYNF